MPAWFSCYVPRTCKSDQGCEGGFHCNVQKGTCVQECTHRTQCRSTEICDITRGRCAPDKPTCTPTNKRACLSGHMHALDSCGVAGAKVQDCGTNGCTESGCNTTLPTKCGDGLCKLEDGENCNTCTKDCPCASTEYCDGVTNLCRLKTTPPDACGDGTCDETKENCSTCPKDCACDASKGLYCLQSACKTPPCVEGQPCNHPEGEGICQEKVCVKKPKPSCQLNQDCQQGQICAQGACRACQQNSECGIDQKCRQGVCIRQIVVHNNARRWSDGTSPASCNAYLNPPPTAEAATQDGVYWLTPGGATPYKAFCNMTKNGGGWTLALKTNGRSKIFAYRSSYWTNKSTYKSDELKLDNTEAKFHSFSTIPFKRVMLGMKLEKAKERDIKYLHVAVNANSLLALFSRSSYTKFSTQLPPAEWRNLVPGGSLQPGCGAQGANYINKDSGGSSVVGQLRFGILGNNENDCRTPDSFIGIGSYMHHQKSVVSTGNYESINNRRNIPMVAYLFVR